MYLIGLLDRKETNARIPVPLFDILGGLGFRNAATSSKQTTNLNTNCAVLFVIVLYWERALMGSNELEKGVDGLVCNS